MLDTLLTHAAGENHRESTVKLSAYHACVRQVVVPTPPKFFGRPGLLVVCHGGIGGSGRGGGDSGAGGGMDLIREWDLNSPRVALTPRTRANQQSASGVGVSTPCEAVSTRGTTVFVPAGGGGGAGVGDGDARVVGSSNTLATSVSALVVHSVNAATPKYSFRAMFVFCH